MNDTEMQGAEPGAAAEETRGGIDRKMLEMLVCPVTHAALDYDRERQELISKRAGLAFPILDGVPVMLVSEARRLED